MLIGAREINALRSVGCQVVETPGCYGRSHGQLPSSPGYMWHHDASPFGPSPGALQWMIDNWENASAQWWINTAGVWHLVGVGRAWHAGNVGDMSGGNAGTVGIETDHTTGEPWPLALLGSLRVGTAALLRLGTRDANNGLWMHKTSAVPYGRKQDPDGLELGNERRIVGNLMTLRPTPTQPVPAPDTPAPVPVPATPNPSEEDDMASYLTTITEDVTGGIYSIRPDNVHRVLDDDSRRLGEIAGLYGRTVDRKTWGQVWHIIRAAGLPDPSKALEAAGFKTKKGLTTLVPPTERKALAR